MWLASIAEIEGWVQVRFDVDDYGRTVGAHIESSDPHGVFDAVSLDAVDQWRYCPGTPSSGVMVRLTFELSDDF